jgi:hypothetical protein
MRRMAWQELTADLAGPQYDPAVALPEVAATATYACPSSLLLLEGSDVRSADAQPVCGARRATLETDQYAFAKYATLYLRQHAVVTHSDVRPLMIEEAVHGCTHVCKCVL